MVRRTRFGRGTAKQDRTHKRRAEDWVSTRAAGLVLMLLLGMLSGVLFLAYFTAGAIYEYRDTASVPNRLPEVDAIVCLAGGRGRIQRASQIWSEYREKGQRPVLYFSGMGKHANWDVLEKQVDSFVFEQLTFQDVVLETQSANTVENARLLGQVAEEREWTRFLLITSSYHMKRARYIFVKTMKGADSPLPKELRDRVRVYILSVQQSSFQAENWRNSLIGIRVTLTEYLKWVFYRMFWT